MDGERNDVMTMKELEQQAIRKIIAKREAGNDETSSYEEMEGRIPNPFAKPAYVPAPVTK